MCSSQTREEIIKRKTSDEIQIQNTRDSTREKDKENFKSDGKIVPVDNARSTQFRNFLRGIFFFPFRKKMNQLFDTSDNMKSYTERCFLELVDGGNLSLSQIFILKLKKRQFSRPVPIK